MILRRAAAGDFDAIREFLAGVNLPTSDLSPDRVLFLVAERKGEIVATAGIEHYGGVGLLRSVATSAHTRGRGVALWLCAEAIHAARERGVRDLYLLTTTASGFFEKLGFDRLARMAAPEAIQQTHEFRELCPDASVFMGKRLDGASADAAVSRLSAAYGRFLGGEPPALLGILAPSAVYHLPGGHMGGGRLQGRDAIVRRALAATRECDAPPTVLLLGAHGDEWVVVTREHFSARRGTSRLDQRVSVLWRLEHDRCVEIWAHFEEQEACDAFWAGWAPHQSESSRRT